MPDFSYEAMSATGTRATGVVTAVNEREAMVILDGRGLMPLKLTEQKSASARKSNKKLKGRVVATFFSQLADLLHSGVPLLRSLELIERQSQNAVLTEVIREVRQKVADGQNIADAMAEFPNAFDELAVSMVRAGMEGGFLEDVLKRIAVFTEQQEDLKSKVIGALAYPVFLAVVGFVVLNVLVIFFVPRFEPIFARLAEKNELPSLTEYLLATSHFLQNHGWWLVLLAFGAFQAFRRWAKTESGRMITDRARLKIPGAGKIYLSLSLSRFTRILGTLLHNGIPILAALKIAKDSTGNKVLSLAIEQSAENITAGNSLAKPLGACPYFPRDVVEMVTIAEESNSLETVLINIADSLEKRTSRNLELFVRLLEPVMLLVMAAVTLLVVAGLLLPVFKMSSAVG
ncbi:type II secretion system F family protein [Tuwongella immobilis]|uniref:General secretion pathway protein F n=1 Tax=Tuwongella immobilis TaxID=692036 RepID=A0A6C2YRW5_9BACT|nr:type II secretion system F family protein [Tuwongella immobilis]VIP04410.1 type iv pilus biogenesis protein : Type 4 fimbrial assembly protein pilC OS=Rhodopirellula baltica (strain SH1) GN=RB3484 PE=4 SV=1: T2SF: T2SF [Tuwongella immobilis]VTS06182.1 type iv pilus biogenesis protein : Type 4 fimbrial assembly protein pilC OS=Rhodopirellula baltica (strain SH1) GN=RB3484 PE=4 SV=1: T2SF: T2SF [Tuwongella immobilis]